MALLRRRFPSKFKQKLTEIYIDCIRLGRYKVLTLGFIEGRWQQIKNENSISLVNMSLGKRIAKHAKLFNKRNNLN